MPTDICEKCAHCKWKPTEDPHIGSRECELDECRQSDDCEDFEFRDAWSE